MSDDKTNAKTGRDALSVPVIAPDGNETLLSFQWMRIHPCTPIALSSTAASQPSSPAVQASKMMKVYEKAAADRINGVNTTSGADQMVPASPFLKASEVHVDLCDLLDPPLLSESLLRSNGIEVEDDDVSSALASALEKSDVAHANSKKQRAGVSNNQRGIERDEVSSLSEGWVDSLLERVDVCLLGGNKKAEHDMFSEETSSMLLSLSKTPTTGGLLQSLNTHLIRQVIQERKSDKESRTDLALLFMSLLAEHASSEVLGRYLLQIMAPSLLQGSCLSTTEECRRHLRRLSTALLVNCSLIRLTRGELHKLTAPPTGPLESEMMDELMCCIGEIFFELKK